MNDRFPEPRSRRTAPPLLLDATMFWSATGGGVRRYLLAKRRWLRRRGTWRHAIAAPGVDPAVGVDVGGVPLPRSGGYRVPVRRRAAAAAMAAVRPDLIEVGDPYRLAWSALDAAQSLGVPAVAFCHSDLAALAERWAGSHPRAASAARRVAEAYLRHAYRQFDLVLAPGRAVESMLRDLGLTRVQRQPLGVDVGIFRPRAPDPGLRARLGLPPDSRLMLYAGRFALEKNLPLLVDATERLGAHYALLVVGAGPLPPPAHERVRVLAYQRRQEPLARLMASVDVFVHAGDRETFGIAALEAMACGTPVVVRASAGLAEIAEGGAGITVDSSRPDAWAEAIAAIFAGDGRARWTTTARQRALEYRWERVLTDLVARYEQLLGAGAR